MESHFENLRSYTIYMVDHYHSGNNVVVQTFICLLNSKILLVGGEGRLLDAQYGFYDHYHRRYGIR